MVGQFSCKSRNFGKEFVTTYLRYLSRTYAYACGCREEAGEAICMCYTEKAREARQLPERQDSTHANRKKQCRPNETKQYSNATHPVGSLQTDKLTATPRV